MILDDTPYLEQVTQRLHTFTQCSSATAVFGHVAGPSHGLHHHLPVRRGLRLEAAGIAKEFTDNIYFGSYLNGFLFYYDVHDFPTLSEELSYHCFYNQETPKTIRVEFHNRKADGSEEEQSFCSFVTKETKNISEAYILAPETHDGSGTWQGVNTASSYGKVRKETSSDEVTVVVEPIGKKIHFSIEGHLTELGINSMGTFTYVNADALQPGSYLVDFCPTRILMYGEHDRFKPIASFIPIRTMNALNDHKGHPACLEDIPVM